MKKPCKTLCILWVSPGALVGIAYVKVLRKGSLDDAVGVLIDANDGPRAGMCKRGLLVFGCGSNGGVNTSWVIPGTKSTTTRCIKDRFVILSQEGG